VLSLFFVPYILLEVPSNILLKRFERPSLYMGMLVTTWGVIMTMHGVVTNYAGLLALRSKFEEDSPGREQARITDTPLPRSIARSF
jgi:hypothetical protein